MQAPRAMGTTGWQAPSITTMASDETPRPDPQYRARDLLGVPCLLSLARVPLGAVFPLVVADARAAIAVIALAGLTDLLDGWWARRFHQTTAIGAVADGATDKVFVLAVVLTLVFTHRLAPWQALVLGARELGEIVLAAVVLLRRDAHARHEEQRADALGKATTVAQFAAVALALVGSPFTGWAALATGAMGLVTVVHYAPRSL